MSRPCLTAAQAVVLVPSGGGGEPGAVLTEVTAALDTAAAASRRLHQALDAAHKALTWAAGVRPGHDDDLACGARMDDQSSGLPNSSTYPRS